jgi:hypothetical protein
MTIFLSQQAEDDLERLLTYLDESSSASYPPTAKYVPDHLHANLPRRTRHH